jgi:hypothetical protein
MPGSIEEKAHPEHEDKVNYELGNKEDGVDRHLQVQIPEVLRGLSPEQIAEIDRKATWKLDVLLMPVLVSLVSRLRASSPTCDVEPMLMIVPVHIELPRPSKHLLRQAREHRSRLEHDVHGLRHGGRRALCRLRLAPGAVEHARLEDLLARCL